MNLLIAGCREEGSPYGDGDQTTVEKRSVNTDGFQVRRCHRPVELVPIVEAVVLKYGKIDILDLYDHGNSGYIIMGSGLLFASDDDRRSELLGAGIAAALSSLLAPTAQVRLLGCNTGAPETAPLRGRLLLVKLARALGAHRTAFGTIRSVVETDFSRYGFCPDLEDRVLFSSHAAIDHEAPTPETRGKHLQRLSPLRYGG